jgi:hypothetical protein
MLQIELLFLSPHIAEQKREIPMIEQSMLHLPREFFGHLQRGQTIEIFSNRRESHP